MPYDIKPESNGEEVLSQSDELVRPLQPDESRTDELEVRHLKPTIVSSELTAVGTVSSSVAAMSR